MFFFKQTTAYEMRLSYWSSDVCSSDLTPVRLARPDTPYSLVPPSLDLPCDRPLNQSAPCTTIGAMLHSDSTLLTTVGRPQAPEICGNGGLARGFARRPSRELIRAVSSPRMMRPAPNQRRRG